MKESDLDPRLESEVVGKKDIREEESERSHLMSSGEEECRERRKS